MNKQALIANVAASVPTIIYLPDAMFVVKLPSGYVSPEHPTIHPIFFTYKNITHIASNGAVFAMKPVEYQQVDLA